MSKANAEQTLIELNSGTVSSESEMLMQVLALLESLKSKTKGKMARISPELTEIFADETNFEKVAKAKNFEELLSVVERFESSNQMLKIHCIEQLRKDFPVLAKKEFL